MAKRKVTTDADTDIDQDNLLAVPGQQLAMEEGMISDEDITEDSMNEQDNIEQEYSVELTQEPVSIPSPIPAPVAGSSWDWVGSPTRPEAQGEDDGISDLFRVDPADVGASEEDLSDLTDVDIERDVLDADEDGSLDNLITVTSEDIMGDDVYGQRPSRPASKQRLVRRRTTPAFTPYTSMRRMQ
jgi:hypothetical protein